MKKIFIILALVITTVSLAQTPEKMSYQAIVRDADGNLLSNTSVGMQISILQSTAEGLAVYVETHSPTTNINGLITIKIGSGSKATGIFSEIDWSSDTYFIKTETDLLGGSSYTISGTSQLLSVPYALHAKKADNVPSYKIGDFAHGGIVFWVDETGQHGLVCANENQSNETKWFAGTFGNTQAKGNGIYAGKTNTSIIISSHVIIGDDNDMYAARLCNELEVIANNVSYGDWYLPSIFELKLINLNIVTINTTIAAIGGDSFLGDSFYWSSVEETESNAGIVNINNGQSSAVLKGSLNSVRAIRSF
ncbi:MAG: hypothetical protein P8L89_09310 [Polaribacter sp.]|jgi:hypothetical protein|nr:hypothetical protein [Polaribacter sp.]